MTHGAADVRPVELTDLLGDVDPVTGRRSPVDVAAADAVLARGGQRHARRVLRRLAGGRTTLPPDEVDALLLRVHLELQRLGEELQMPRRVSAWLTGVVEANGATSRDPLLVVDVGCGLGHVVRWLAADGGLDGRLRLVGVDQDPALVAHARRLAAVERLDCTFVVGDALDPHDVPGVADGAVLVSSGLLHHLSPEALPDFFAAHGRLGVRAFSHWDAMPGPWTTAGAWVFHRARMREAVSRHDGVLSVRRAYPAATLLEAASVLADRYDVTCRDVWPGRPAFVEALRPVAGTAR